MDEKAMIALYEVPNVVLWQEWEQTAEEQEYKSRVENKKKSEKELDLYTEAMKDIEVRHRATEQHYEWAKELQSLLNERWAVFTSWAEKKRNKRLSRPL